MTVMGRRIDWRAVAVAAAVTAVGEAAVFNFGYTWHLMLVVAGLGGAVAGVFSRNYEDEFVDGGVGTLVGSLAAPLLLTVYYVAPVGGAYPGAGFVMFSWGTLAAVALAPVPAIIGSVTAGFAAGWHRQLRAELGV